ncbi:hypothetical protein [Amnibacterium kyonggiense]
MLRLHALSDVADPGSRAIIYESVILRIARAHENFIEKTFLSYLVGDRTDTGGVVGTFVRPKDLKHARKLVSSSTGARFLDWSDVSEVRARCEVFFEEDSPLYEAAGVKSAELSWMKKIRNQAAHDSVESRLSYSKALETILLTVPAPVPSAGNLLQMTPRKGPMKNHEVLSFFIDSVRQFAHVAAGVAPI